MERNYYCNGVWFDSYHMAKMYAEEMGAELNKFLVVFTKEEMDSQINHEKECGK